MILKSKIQNVNFDLQTIRHTHVLTAAVGTRRSSDDDRSRTPLALDRFFNFNRERSNRRRR